MIRAIELDSGQRSAANLTPVIAQLFAWLRDQKDFTERSPGSAIVDFVSVANGPGSFTGLRIGVTTAKTLSYALSLPLVAIDSLAAIAAAGFVANEGIDSILVAIDAFRGQVFCGLFDRFTLMPAIDTAAPDWTPHPRSVEIQSASVFQKSLDARDPDLAMAGDAKAFGSFADRRLPSTCDAIGVGRLATRAAQLGLFTDPLELLPRYLKQSAAEEKAGNNDQAKKNAT